MDVIRGIENIPTNVRGAFVTIGNFDGVHLGHRHIFRRLVEEAGAKGRPSVVISFDPHPKQVLHPERRPFYLITSLEEKIRLIGETGIGTLILIPFTLEYARTTAEAFIRTVLWERLRTGKILIGHDYTFGRGKEGNATFLAEFSRQLGFTVEVMDAFQMGGQTVSSTRIRKAILEGGVGTAANLLGRPYNLRGKVIPGRHRGVGLGFPTANIHPEKELLPPRGVYAARAMLKGKRLEGVVNIGFNPTFADKALSIEVHLFDFKEDIYGETLDVLFIERLRDEIRFASPEALIAQIDRDIARAREILQRGL